MLIIIAFHIRFGLILGLEILDFNIFAKYGPVAKHLIANDGNLELHNITGEGASLISKDILNLP